MLMAKLGRQIWGLRRGDDEDGILQEERDL
jgi:hypothetical protein